MASPAEVQETQETASSFRKITMRNGTVLNLPADSSPEQIMSAVQKFEQLSQTGQQPAPAPQPQAPQQNLRPELEQPIDLQPRSIYSPRPQDFQSRPMPRETSNLSYGQLYTNQNGENFYAATSRRDNATINVFHPDAVEAIQSGQLKPPETRGYAQGIEDYYNQRDQLRARRDEGVAIPNFRDPLTAFSMGGALSGPMGGDTGAMPMPSAIGVLGPGGENIENPAPNIGAAAQALAGTIFVGEAIDEAAFAAAGILDLVFPGIYDDSAELIEYSRGTRAAFLNDDPATAATAYNGVKIATGVYFGSTRLGQAILTPKGGNPVARLASNVTRGFGIGMVEGGLEGGFRDKTVSSVIQQGLTTGLGTALFSGGIGLAGEGLKTAGNSIAGRPIRDFMKDYNISREAAEFIQAAAKTGDADTIALAVQTVAADIPLPSMSKNFETLFRQSFVEGSPATREAFRALQTRAMSAFDNFQSFMGRYLGGSDATLSPYSKAIFDAFEPERSAAYQLAYRFNLDMSSPTGVALLDIVNRTPQTILDEVAEIMALRKNPNFGTSNPRNVPGSQLTVEYFDQLKQVYQDYARAAAAATPPNTQMALLYNNAANDIKTNIVAVNSHYGRALGMGEQSFIMDDALRLGYNLRNKTVDEVNLEIARFEQAADNSITVNPVSYDVTRALIRQGLRMRITNEMDQLVALTGKPDVTPEQFTEAMSGFMGKVGLQKNLENLFESPEQFAAFKSEIDDLLLTANFNYLMNNLQKESALVATARVKALQDEPRGETAIIQQAAGEGPNNTLFFGPLQYLQRIFTSTTTPAKQQAATLVADEIGSVLLQMTNRREAMRFYNHLQAMKSEHRSMDQGIARGLQEFLIANQDEVAEIFALIQPQIFGYGVTTGSDYVIARGPLSPTIAEVGLTEEEKIMTGFEERRR